MQILLQCFVKKRLFRRVGDTQRFCTCLYIVFAPFTAVCAKRMKHLPKKALLNPFLYFFLLPFKGKHTKCWQNDANNLLQWSRGSEHQSCHSDSCLRYPYSLPNTRLSDEGRYLIFDCTHLKALSTNSLNY